MVKLDMEIVSSWSSRAARKEVIQMPECPTCRTMVEATFKCEGDHGDRDEPDGAAAPTICIFCAEACDECGRWFCPECIGPVEKDGRIVDDGDLRLCVECRDMYLSKFGQWSNWTWKRLPHPA